MNDAQDSLVASKQSNGNVNITDTDIEPESVAGLQTTKGRKKYTKGTVSKEAADVSNNEVFA